MSILILVGFYAGAHSVLLLHELGHLIIARHFGIRILQVSIGLGPALVKFTDKERAVWVLRLLPLGAKLEMDDKQEPLRAPVAFSQKSNLTKTAIYGAGPLVSLGFAGVIFVCDLALHQGVSWLSSLAAFSFLLGMFSLLPILPLDGGWVALFLIQAVFKIDVSARTLSRAGRAGVALVTIATTIALLVGGAALLNF